MLRLAAHIKLVVMLMWTSVTLLTGSAFAQSPPSDLKSEVDILKAENAAVRELLRRMEEQQKALLEQVERLQRRLDGAPTAAAPSDAGNASEPPASVENQDKEDRYQDGIVIWQNAENARVPFLLRFNNNTQIRYLNTLDSGDTFTDHLGNAREIHQRNDITVNRSMFIFAGYMFDPKLQYSLTVWTSAGAASIVVAGNIGWRFNRGLTLTGGYTGVPGSRSLVTSSRRRATITELRAAFSRTGSAWTFDGPESVCSSTPTSRSGKSGSPATASRRIVCRSASLRLKDAMPDSRPATSLTSESRNESRAQDFSASSSSRRCWSDTGPARSLSSIRR